MKVVIFIVISFVFVGCELFETRKPEDPTSPRTNWIPATSAGILISNFKNSFSDKSTENYLNCFVDSILTGKTFSFIPTSEGVILFPTLFSNWNVTNERSYFENIKSKLRENSSFSLSCFSENEGTIAGDSMTYSADYLLFAEHGVSDIPKEFHGHMQMTLFRNTRGEWAISFWRDSKRDEFPTWSELKGRFSY
ncbi:MAG: hypothetical protein FJ213_00960 [Ignavibacteria bacterium]|nr:hypothetical protein [Ignavibacteria bacterium]